MMDTLIGFIVLIGLQFFKKRADQELADKKEADEYNRALDEKETP
jgi:hypothetical protein